MTETERRYQARRQLWESAFQHLDLSHKTVLDAGTGEGWFTRFLAEQGLGRLVSITCLPGEIDKARSTLGELVDSVEFHIADLCAMPEIPDASFDVVGADYLIAAVAAYRPYREIDCLKELVRVLRPGGRLVVTGWEVGPRCRIAAERLFQKLLHLRDAVHTLRGEIPFREHPRFWIEERLCDLGMPIERHHTVPDIHHDLTWLIGNVQKFIAQLEGAAIRESFIHEVEHVAAELHASRALVGGLEFGRLYAVVAMKLDPRFVLGTTA